MIRIAIVDDDILARNAMTDLAARWARDIEVLMAAATVDELTTAGVLRRADVVLLDVMLGPGQSLNRNVGLITEAGSRVLIVTCHSDLAELHRVLAQHAVGAVDKNTLARDFRDVVSATARGEIVISPTIREAAPNVVDVPLTPRQQEVFVLVSSGRPVKAIAHQLGIARETVYQHVRDIERRFREAGQPIPTLIEKHRLAQELGYLPGPPSVAGPLDQRDYADDLRR